MMRVPLSKVRSTPTPGKPHLPWATVRCSAVSSSTCSIILLIWKACGRRAVRGAARSAATAAAASPRLWSGNGLTLSSCRPEQEQRKAVKAQRRAGLSGKALLDDFGDDVADLVDMADGLGRQSGCVRCFASELAMPFRALAAPRPCTRISTPPAYPHSSCPIRAQVQAISCSISCSIYWGMPFQLPLQSSKTEASTYMTCVLPQERRHRRRLQADHHLAALRRRAGVRRRSQGPQHRRRRPAAAGAAARAARQIRRRAREADRRRR